MTTPFPLPKRKEVQIRPLPDGTYKVRCRHGWEKADTVWFAHVLWDAAWNKRPPMEAEPTSTD